MMEKCELRLRDICDDSKVFKLNDGSAFVLGRNRETQIEDTRCSRVQLLVTPNFKEKNVIVEQVGSNPSAVNGVQLRKGEKRKARHDDIIEVLESRHFFKLEFTPHPNPDNMGDNRPSCSRESQPSTSQNGDITESKKNMETRGSLDHFLKDSALQAVGSWKKMTPNSLLVFSYDEIKSREKIAAFDLDGTIISTISGNVFPKDINDWKLIFPEVASKLKELHESNYKLVFFTNQAAIGRGKLRVSDFKKKVEAIVRKLRVPVQIFVATADDIYRKPRTGMWEFFEQNENSRLKINYDETFYCGDAAGRPAHCEPNKKKKDFSLADRLFALNLNIKFFTPEEYFLGWKAAPFNLPEFCPSSLLTDGPLLDPASSDLVSKSQEADKAGAKMKILRKRVESITRMPRSHHMPDSMIGPIVVMIGCPGSGKSFFSKSYLVSAGYVHVNRDTLKTWQKCVSLTEKSVRNKLSVVVDNTSPDKESRARYTKIGKEFNIPVRAFWMSTTLEHAKHNNTFRQILRDDTHDYIPNHSLNSFFNILEPPTLDEGFTEIVRANFIPRFKDDKEKRIYNMYLLET